MFNTGAISQTLAGHSTWLWIAFAQLTGLQALLVYFLFRYLGRHWRKPASGGDSGLALAEAEALRHLGLAALVVDVRERILAVNELALELSGYPLELLRGRNYQALISIGDDEAAAAVPRGSGGKTACIEHLATLVKRDGGRLPVQVAVAVVQRRPLRALITLRVLASPVIDGPRLRQLQCQAGLLRQFAGALESFGGNAAAAESLRIIKDLAGRIEQELSPLAVAGAGAALTDGQPQLGHFGRWLLRASESHLELTQRRHCELELPHPAAAHFLALLDTAKLESVHRLLLDFAFDTLDASAVSVQVSHQALPQQPVCNRGIRGDHLRQLSLIYLVRNPEGQLLFQLSLPCQCFAAADAIDRQLQGALHHGRAAPSSNGTLPSPRLATPRPIAGEAQCPAPSVWLIATDSEPIESLVAALALSDIASLRIDLDAASRSLRTDPASAPDWLILDSALPDFADFDLTYELRQGTTARPRILLVGDDPERLPPRRVYHAYDGALQIPLTDAERLTEILRIGTLALRD